MRAHLDPRRFSHWLAALGSVALFASMAEAADASCRATRVGRSARVSVAALDLLDAELFRLVRLGMEGRIDVELKAVRRGFIFGRTVGRALVETVLSWSPSLGALLVDGVRAEDPRTLVLPRMAVEVDAGPDDEIEIEVEVRLRVVTAQSLGDVARWIAGNERGQVSKNVLGAIADDLTRQAGTTCAARRVRAETSAP